MRPVLTIGLGAVLLAGAATAVLAQPPAAPQAPTVSDSTSAPTTAPTPEQIAKGQATFQQRCKDCHDPAVGEAPEKSVLAVMAPDDIFTTLKSGLMQPMADGLSDDDMHAVAAYLTTGAAK